ncbi:MAG: sensor histidine kinase [Oscillospiraceae bacterium]|nr:sensor histidine kinase [Oscillospiraceae bacterium]
MAGNIRRKGGSAAPVFIQTTCWIMLCWFVLLSFTLGLTLRYSLSTLQEKIDDTLRAVVTTIATSPAVQEALTQNACDPELAAYLDELVAAMEDLDVITIADENSIRVYHINKARIGEKFVGGDEGRALAGESYFSDATGTMGFQHRFFCPVTNGQGQVIGFVMGSTTQSRMEELHRSINTTYIKLMGILVLCTLVFSGALAIYLNYILRGAKPEDLVKTYLTQSDVLNSLDEGLISLDPTGRVRLVNQTAAAALGKKEELLLGMDVDSLLRLENGESLKDVRGENLATSRTNILVNSLYVKNSSRWARQVLILKDRSELRRQAEQLGGTRHIISALRANNHEFINKLQVISGLLQMDRAEDALEYIGSISAEHAHTLAPVMQLIQNANVAALILGKLNNMRELDIRLTLLANSHLPEHSRYLTTQELVTVVGNLLENAIEAVNVQNADAERRVVLQITEDETGLLIVVSDSGEGIREDILPRIFESGFSTKADHGRGVGMGLVRSIAERNNGTIEVDSEPDAGSTFTLIFNTPRGGTV